MTIVLQGDDVLRYHPETGLPLVPEDFEFTIDSDGRKIFHLGDCNKPKERDEK
jgi:hypothetical protein